MTLTVKIAPSDFAYLFRECPRCTYLKLRHGLPRPYMPFPSVFHQLDKLLRGHHDGRELRELIPDAPPGKINTRSLSLKAEVERGGVVFRISGRTDAHIDHPDGSMTILDFKVTGSDPQADRYLCQLAAYALGAEQTLHRPVAAVGLLIVTPVDTRPTPTQAETLLSTTNRYALVPWDAPRRDILLSELDRLAELLTGPLPQPDGKCSVCSYTARFVQSVLIPDGMPDALRIDTPAPVQAPSRILTPDVPSKPRRALLGPKE